MTPIKFFAEIRFGAQPDIFDKKSDIIKAIWPKYFKHWAVFHGKNECRFFNEPKIDNSYEFLGISPTNFYYSSEYFPSSNYFMEKLKKYFKEVKKWIIASEYSRIGIRSYHFLREIKFDDFVKSSFQGGNIFNGTYFKEYNEANNIKDFCIVLENDTSRLQLGPMRKKENHPLFNEVVQKDNLPAEFYFIDLDCWAQKASETSIETVLLDLYNKASTLPGHLK